MAGPYLAHRSSHSTMREPSLGCKGGRLGEQVIETIHSRDCGRAGGTLLEVILDWG